MKKWRPFLLWVLFLIGIGLWGWLGDGMSTGAFCVTPVFSPNGGIRNRILTEIGKLKKGDTLRVAVYNISDNATGDSVIALHHRGGVPLIYTDRAQAAQLYSEISKFESDSIQVRYKPSSGIMHNKFAIFRNSLLFTGSYNWSNSAETINEENVTIFKSSIASENVIIKRYKVKFDSLWTKGGTK